MKQEKRSLCPISGALELIGDRWTLLIIRDIYFLGKTRFEEFLESPEKISTNILSDRLKRLEETGLITKTQYGQHSKRMSYSLTERGQKLEGVLRELIKWGLENISDTKIPKTMRTKN
jgi:DNA-binding HxlR family transcriptional regulator